LRLRAPAATVSLEAIPRLRDVPSRTAMPRKRRSRAKFSPAELRAELRRAGLRSTAPRVAVLDRVCRATTPPSHAELVEELAPQGFDRVTIYRNLVDLVDAGLLARIELGDHLWRFERRSAADAPASEHPHFVCNDCGTVACLSAASVRIRPVPGRRRSGVAEVSEVLLRGRCDRC